MTDPSDPSLTMDPKNLLIGWTKKSDLERMRCKVIFEDKFPPTV